MWQATRAPATNLAYAAFTLWGVTDTFATLDVVAEHAAANTTPPRPHSLADHVMKGLSVIAVSGIVAFLLIVLGIVARWVAALTGVWPLHD